MMRVSAMGRSLRMGRHPLAARTVVASAALDHAEGQAGRSALRSYCPSLEDRGCGPLLTMTLTWVKGAECLGFPVIPPGVPPHLARI